MPEIAERLSAALEDRYHIERELGEGGMATVYLAEDLRHDRKVALKVLKPELAAVVGGERFLAEIKTTAQLQHPHILPLHDSGEADSFLFYVMPYIEGESLREKLEREQQLPVEEALAIAEQLAAALQYAHEQGVVHRDIKPANILLSRGEPVIADFGIALAVSEAGGGRITETGLSLGTPHYMSPEQASGDRTLDRRSDLYALACVLYEMLAGKPPFDGPNVQAVLGRILTGRSDPVTQHRSSVAPNVDAALSRALERLPADRFDDVAEFARALRNPAFRWKDDARGAGGSSPHGRPWKLIAGIAGLALLLGGVTGWLVRRPTPVGNVIRYALELPEGEQLATSEIRPRLALSPDGSQLAYVGEASEGPNQLWLRRRDQMRATPLPGTADAHSPFFSPDGSAVGFVRGSTAGAQSVVVVSLSGRPPVVLVDTLVGQDGGAWGDDGFIYYDGLTGGGTRGIMRVPASGGTPEQVTAVDTAAGETDHIWPHVLPGSKGLLFTIIRGSVGEADIAVMELPDGQPHPLVRGVSARYLESGHLVWVTADGMAMGARFDLGSLDVVGEPVPLLDGLVLRLSGSVDLAVSATGRLAYYQGAPGVERWSVVGVDLNGNSTVFDANWAPGDIRSPSLSPDGQRLAVSIGTNPGDIWVKELPRGALTRLTAGTGETDHWRPVWSPDGERIGLIYDPVGPQSQAVAIPAGAGPVAPDPLLPPERPVAEVEFAGTDRSLLFRDDTGVFTATIGDSSPPTPLWTSEFNDRALALSPDGQRLAYVSDSGGRDEVYVRPFPDAGTQRVQVSTGGGTEPVWAHGGERLFYRDGENWMTVATLATDPLRITDRQRLFDASPYRADPDGRMYDVMLDDLRLVMLRTTGFGQTESGRLVLVENWFRELKETMEAAR